MARRKHKCKFGMKKGRGGRMVCRKTKKARKHRR